MSGMDYLRRGMRFKENIDNLTMRYEDGGKTQVFALNGKEVRIPASIKIDDILSELASSL